MGAGSLEGVGASEKRASQSEGPEHPCPDSQRLRVRVLCGNKARRLVCELQGTDASHSSASAGRRRLEGGPFRLTCHKDGSGSSDGWHSDGERWRGETVEE